MNRGGTMPCLRLLIPAVVALTALAVSGCAARGASPEAKAAEEAQALKSAQQADRQGNLDVALLEYVRVLSINPENAEVHFRVGRIQAGRGEKAIAREAYVRTLALKPDHAGALEGLGLLLLEQGEHKLAHQILERAAAQDEPRWQVLNGLGVLADLEGKHEQAQSYFRQALALLPDRAEVLNNLGYSLYLAGDLRGAQEQFERALKFNPDYSHAWSNLGLVHTRNGRYPQAVRAFAHVMELPAAYYSAGYICFLDGSLAEAERLLRSAIRESPSYYESAQKALSRVQEARAAAAETGTGR